MKLHFLGMAASYSTAEVWQHTFAWGKKQDCRNLKRYLRKHYLPDANQDTSRVILCKNGRSALALALKAYFNPGDAILVNGFTCYAVYEAVKAAKLTPVWADISSDNLNFSIKTLDDALKRAWAGDNSENVTSTGGIAEGGPPRRLRGGRDDARTRREDDITAGPAQNIKGIIIQNTLGNPIDITVIERFAKKHNLTIIEDLAHSVGVKYPDGREAGTVGAGVAFSFGKDKSIDTISGGAVILRTPVTHRIKAPSKLPKPSDHMRARFYPMWGLICRRLTTIHLGGPLMRCLIKIHWVEKSADNKLDLTRKISKFEAKLALRQFKNLKESGEPPLRQFYLVNNREEVIKDLQHSGYYFGGFWYEKPVSPARYYHKVNFPEQDCQVATKVAKQIINFPNYYSKQDLTTARKIIQPYLAAPTKEEDK